MSVHYHPGKKNVLEDALRKLSMGNVSHVDEESKELVRDVHRLARLGVRLMTISPSGLTTHNEEESSFIVDGKEKQDSHPILLELKGFIPRGRWCTLLPRKLGVLESLQ